MKVSFSKRLLLKAVITICFLAVLLNPSISAKGAQKGLLLWFQSILPILLPFLILSSLMISLDAMHYLTFLFEPLICRLFHLSSKGCFALLNGLFCGYPMGAKLTADLYQHHHISKTEAQYLLHFCNNVSPAFTISYLCTTLLQDNRLIRYLLPSIYLAPFLCAFFLKPLYHLSKKAITDPSPTQPEQIKQQPPRFSFSMIDQAIMNSFEAVTKLGGYIILFSILSSFVGNLNIPSWAKCILLGITEFSTGCTYLGMSSFSLFIRVLSICVCASFGGLSSIAQTQSMIQESGLSIFYYITGKLLCAACSGILLCILFYLFPLAP